MDSILNEPIDKVAIIMAGGTNWNLWPRSLDKTLKQFIRLIGEGTMIQNTFQRLLPVFKLDNIFVVTSENCEELVKNQLPYLPLENIILEPFGRNTAPCIALAASVIERKFPGNVVMMAFPADHSIENVREFHDSLEIAAEIADKTKAIVTIGITPSRPETGFGYVQIIENDEEIKSFYDMGVRKSAAFAEKPDIDTAKRFMESGDFLWNSGIFVWNIETFWEAFHKFLPEHDLFFNLLKKNIGKKIYHNVLNDIYRQMEARSIDYAILEKAKNVYVVESTFSWSDLGNWDELYRLSFKDARNNFVEGNVVTINSSNCLISAEDKLVGIVGVDNLIIVDTPDSLLICKRGASEQTMEIVDYLKRKNITSHL